MGSSVEIRDEKSTYRAAVVIIVVVAAVLVVVRHDCGCVWFLKIGVDIEKV